MPCLLISKSQNVGVK